MKRETQWFILAVIGLMLAAGHLGLALRGDAPAWGEIHAGGGADGQIISYSQDSGANTLRIYVLDVQQKCLMVYQSDTGSGELKFIQGRPFAFDAELSSKAEVGYQRNGYSLSEVQRALRNINRKPN